jgi:hypothetical protein
LINTSWQLGPASDRTALSVSAIPAASAAACKFFPGQSQHITADGVGALLRTIDQPDKHWQSLCVTDLDGLGLTIALDLSAPGTSHTTSPGSGPFGSALAVLGHLRLLGPDPASWTASPAA